MANPKHVAKLKEGVQAWNAWRAKRALRIWNILPDGERTNDSGLVIWEYLGDLAGADLRSAQLGAANLIGANLSGANLSSALLTLAVLSNASLDYANLNHATLGATDLSQAHLGGAKLRNANLVRANLTEANLIGADLTSTDLRLANLTGANFHEAILRQTRVAKANFREAKFSSTFISAVDLSECIDLVTASHAWPSAIGFDTIVASRGNIPKVFLQGAGVPEPILDLVPAIINSLSPIQFYSCFISYSRTDEDIAHSLYVDLQASNVRTWYAPDDLKPGEYILAGIDNAIKVRDKLLLILSEASISSNWVRHEVEAALAEEMRRGTTVLFPIRLDDTVLGSVDSWAQRLQARHIADFRGWKDHDTYQAAFKLLLKHLQAEAEREMGAGHG